MKDEVGMLSARRYLTLFRKALAAFNEDSMAGKRTVTSGTRLVGNNMTASFRSVRFC